jgi:hypothetical protein
VRLPGARITGNPDLGGADLSSPTGDAFDATGVTVGGSLLAGRHRSGPDIDFTASGRVLIAGARIGGDLVFAGATLHRDVTAPEPDLAPRGNGGPVIPGGIVDGSACLVADRITVEGNLELDDGLRSDGTVRLPNAVVGGYVRLSGARMSAPPGAGVYGIALLGDGMKVGGVLEAGDSGRGPLVCTGQMRLIDADVRGSASMSGIDLRLPGGYALLADRLRVGGEFFLRRVRCEGTIRLPDAEIGATLDCTGARLDRPRLREDGTARPSLDARSASIGKDVLCSAGFSAAGGVRVRRMEALKSVQFIGAVLGDARTDPRYALNAYGLVTPEFVLQPAEAPAGRVRLAQARVGTFSDSAELWHATGGMDLDGFDYQKLNDTRLIDVRTRLKWLERVTPDYAPGPYEQLAAAYLREGDDGLSEQVLMARQRRRYAESNLIGRIWGRLQEWTVGFGYRPWLAVCWLVLFAALGGWWFALNEPLPVDDGQNPVFNPWLFAADTLLPIINLGQDGYWRLEGPSQWISSGLVAVGWILATTAAAGAARILKRV